MRYSNFTSVSCHDHHLNRKCVDWIRRSRANNPETESLMLCFRVVEEEVVLVGTFAGLEGDRSALLAQRTCLPGTRNWFKEVSKQDAAPFASQCTEISHAAMRPCKRPCNGHWNRNYSDLPSHVSIRSVYPPPFPEI